MYLRYFQLINNIRLRSKEVLFSNSINIILASYSTQLHVKSVLFFTKNKIITIASNLWNFIRMFIERSIYFKLVTTCSISFFLLFATVHFKILLQNVNKMSLSLQNFRAWLTKTACNNITVPVTLAGFPAKAKTGFSTLWSRL